ncbi:MAG: hypothetical protein HQL19_02605 [Candidatus Omnitrophica bacterium]|nr:hypothetical protein [Candidatus Omnitrophota bacterium]
MKKILMAGCLSVLMATGAMLPACAAFPEEDGMVILTQKDIPQLSDEKLINAYIDVLVELDASKAFHSTSGFTPKEYNKYKDILKYRLFLLFEIQRRKLELPPMVN